jgi:geranylgeranyl diphosphate synthase type II
MINVSLRLGGLIGRADERQLAALDAYGRAIGLAFQIVDDLLDLNGDEQTMGKRLQKDSQHGKLTFPSLLGVDESRRRAQTLVDQACAAVALFENRSAGLEALARYVVERNH